MALRPSRWIPLLMVPLVGGSLLWLSADAKSGSDDALVTTVKRGTFTVTVTAAGELVAPRSVKVEGPAGATRAAAFSMEIASLVPEGTIVKKGDVVAALDRAMIAPRLEEVRVALEKAEAQFTQAKLDTALSLAQAREEIRNLELALEESRLAREQAVFEAPTVQRQAELDYERTKRELAQARTSYVTKQEQAVAKTTEVAAEVSRQRSHVEAIEKMMDAFTIRAPASGMVIYAREWNGRKRGVGSDVTPWDPVVATIPDLSEMESLTYVNEVDIAKVAVGQPVRITLDADPTKRLTGQVTQVANVGEQRPNSDAKVFEVTIKVDDPDGTIRPGMTTANVIETASVPDALFIPLEAVMNQGDIAFVYLRNGVGIVRQEIETGLMSENEIEVRRGLEADQQVLLSPPENANDLPLVRLP